MHSYVLGLQEVDSTMLMEVGGKGLNLAELSRIEGLRVPDGFCITTEAYKKIVGNNERYNALLNQLITLTLADRDQIQEISGAIRNLIEGDAVQEEIQYEISRWHTKLGDQHGYAIRSSATAEDLPSASFAGQQDTYLNIIGLDSILRHISKCWASLFTERAVIYRKQNGFDHRKVYISVVIQRMLFPQASGIMFTADPVTSKRKVTSIDASFGLGEALVSGLVDTDMFKVQDGRIVEGKIAVKKIAIYALKKGGTEQRRVDPESQSKPSLTDEQVLQLELMGRKIEDHFGCPQDIEWCLEEDKLYIVQSRPITTLYPVPEPSDGQNRVYMSVGHQQMMTEAIKPLGMSFFQLISYAPMVSAGGRLFLDVTHDLASPIGRKIILNSVGKNDPLMHNAFSALVRRKDYIRSLPRGKRIIGTGSEAISAALPFEIMKIYWKNDETIIPRLISKAEASLNKLQEEIAGVSGEELFEFIKKDNERLKKVLYDPQSLGAIMVGVFAAYWLNKKMDLWLGEKSAADTLSQSVPNNITSEMGLDLLDVSDVVRRYPAVMNYFRQPGKDTLFEDLAGLEGGEEVSRALQEYLAKYGMRCSGEIDITKQRWSEQPTALLPMILSNINNFEPNARRSKFERGRMEAEQKEKELLSQLALLPGGNSKVKKTKKMISLLRNFAGYREYPKYSFISRYYIYKQALLREAAVLVQKGIIEDKEDIYYLSFEELREAVRTGQLDYQILNERKEDYAVSEKLTPPRVITSEGEIIIGEYSTVNLPPGALAGIPVSSGIIAGRARIVTKMEDADLEAGDILVTAFTDPSWTPLFVSVNGLVTEVGGRMTHGAVIAREYGLPAVVGVENATKLIKDGQRIRINGTEGYVELLGE